MAPAESYKKRSVVILTSHVIAFIICSLLLLVLYLTDVLLKINYEIHIYSKIIPCFFAIALVLGFWSTSLKDVRVPQNEECSRPTDVPPSKNEAQNIETDKD
ncbi:MAG: hypothetical protein LBU65_09455 [Planctomycetaceae bacterium]|nr:hypothetical protein [Planctomycetaceae bacterium]